MESFFCNITFNKHEIEKLIYWFLINYGTTRATKLVDKIKTLGFKYATEAGISLSVDDLKIPKIKQCLLTNAENEIAHNEYRFSTGEINTIEHLQKVIEVWNTTNELLKNECIINFRQTNLLNPVYMMAFSGARGNISQVRQLVGMRGLMTDSQGEIIHLPIKSNFRDGLNITEYLISCYGARKGLVDTALRTANAGYLTRRLVDVAQSIIIRQGDCKTYHGVLVTPLIRNKKTYISVERRLRGRVLAKDILNKDNKLIAARGQDVCSYVAKNIVENKGQEIFVRSPLACKSAKSVCQLCYGWNMAHGRIAQIGETVGITAAQSIGEPGTQLTMRTFHTGGVFSSSIKKRIYAPISGIVRYSIRRGGRKIRTRYGQKAFFTLEEKELSIEKEGNNSKIALPRYTVIFVRSGEKIHTKQILGEISSMEEIFSNTKDDIELEKKTVKSRLDGQIYFDRITILKSKQAKENGLIWILHGELSSEMLLVKHICYEPKEARNKEKWIKSHTINLKDTKVLRGFSLYMFTKKLKEVIAIRKEVNKREQNKKKNLSPHIPKNIKTIYRKVRSIKQQKDFKEVKLKRSKVPRKRINRAIQEIKSLTNQKQNLVYSKFAQRIIPLQKDKTHLKVGNLIIKGQIIAPKIKSEFSGQVVQIQKNIIVLQEGTPNLISRNTVVNVANNELISRDTSMFNLIYNKSKMDDIVQGLPKIEELLEARRTNNLGPINDNPHSKLANYFEEYKQTCQNDIATSKSLERIQKTLIDNIQIVYHSQGIRIADKHVEIIVKRMTSNVLIQKPGETTFLTGETIELNKIERINEKIKDKVEYEPILLGISRASLDTESFISAASFQDTTKILTQAAIEGKIDWLHGLKENLILGRLIPAGTGINEEQDEQIISLKET